MIAYVQTTQPQTAAPATVQTRSSVIHTMRDTQFGNTPVASMRLPAGWRAQSALRWNFNEMSAPVNMFYRATNASGTLAFEGFPMQRFYWIQPAGWNMHPVGSKDFGVICAPPVGADKLLSSIIGLVRPGARIVHTGPSNLLASLPATPPVTVQTIMMRAEYTVSGQLWEEEFHAVRDEAVIPNYGPQGVLYQINWGLLHAHSFRAKKSELEPNRPMFEAIYRSIRRNLEWESLRDYIFAQIGQQFDAAIQAGYDRINAAVAMSQQISRNNDSMLRGFQQTRAEQNRHVRQSSAQRSSNDAFSDYIRGVNTYDDPYWGQSQHSNTQDYVWTDGFGNYQTANDPTYNPNIGSNVNWQQMNRL